MRIERLSFQENVNIGIYIVATESYALIPRQMLKKRVQDLVERVLEVPVYGILTDAPFLGALIAANSQGALLSPLLGENVKQQLESDLDLKVAVLDKKYFAVGNIILTNDSHTMAAEFVGDDDNVQIIKDTLDTEVEVTSLTDLIGSMVALNEHGAVISPYLSTAIDPSEFVEILGIQKAAFSTVNKGHHFVASGLLVNSKGCIVGEDTTGIEILDCSKVLDPEL